MSNIILWGVEYGKCMPMAGCGFRHEFSSSKDADFYIRTACSKVRWEEIDHYAIYITGEFTGLDAVMHYHNWKDSDHHYKEGHRDIEEVDMKEIKAEIDLQWKLHKQRLNRQKMAIDSELKSMTREDLLHQERLFKETSTLAKQLTKGD